MSNLRDPREHGVAMTVAADEFATLFREAECVRWKLEDIPWGTLDRTRVTPELLQLVADVAASEATTFSATQRFFADFADDVAFTNWLAVWFYEETKHPHVLLTWLTKLGEPIDEQRMRRARVTAPLMRSRIATLASNIISEMVASARYMSLSEHSPEPVLAVIAQRLAADEARHAASFYAFALRRLNASKAPEVDRRDVLKVLYLWTSDRDQMRHPVNMFQSVSTAATTALQGRVVHTIGLLVGAPLRTAQDVLRHLKELPQS
jgi:ferritin